MRILIHNPQTDAGFTLLELLVAMTLLGFLTALMFDGLRFGRRAWETTENAAQLSNTIRTFQYTLRDELSRAYPLLQAVDATHANIAFEGAADHVSFFAPDVEGVPSGEMARVTIEADKTAVGSIVKISSAPELAVSDDVRTRSLELPGITSLAFAYYGKDKPNDAPTWRNDWDSHTELPELIRVSAHSPHDDAVWPDLVIRPHIAVDEGCTYDALTKFCQGR
ncbi:MAG TPA: prepilin-type N-terminal cleavage/methylation domain-containing protein [Rhizomicrobium sp.]|nr:prepilin-type N-terminal cleavage/methylation domain-containing protein [Rhizomicrobium sp.]